MLRTNHTIPCSMRLGRTTIRTENTDVSMSMRQIRHPLKQLSQLLLTIDSAAIAASNWYTASPIMTLVDAARPVGTFAAEGGSGALSQDRGRRARLQLEHDN